jgi:hypothetical protein
VHDPSLQKALRAAEPVEALCELVLEWKRAGVTQAEATERLQCFLHEVQSDPLLDDDPIRDVLDFVVGYCSKGARLFP